MGKKYFNKKGEERTWFSPNERRKKYCVDIKNKVDSVTGEPLTSTQLAYRSGYSKRAKEEIDLYYFKNQEKYKEKYGEDKYKEKFGKKKSVSESKSNKRKKEVVQPNFYNQFGN